MRRLLKRSNRSCQATGLRLARDSWPIRGSSVCCPESMHWRLLRDALERDGLSREGLTMKRIQRFALVHVVAPALLAVPLPAADHREAGADRLTGCSTRPVSSRR